MPSIRKLARTTGLNTEASSGAVASRSRNLGSVAR
jgi:hypothetical protein